MMRQTEKWFTDRFFDLFFPAEGLGGYSCQLPETISLKSELTLVVCGAGSGVLEATIAKDLCRKASVINIAFIDISDEPLSMLHWILQHHEDRKDSLRMVFDAGTYPRIELEKMYHTSIEGCWINYAFFVENLELNPNPENGNYILEDISDKPLRERFNDFLPHILEVISGVNTTRKHEIDVVIMSMILQHLSYWRSLISYFNRYLSEEGIFLINEFGKDDYLLGFDISNALMSEDTAKMSELQKIFKGLVDRQFSILSDNNEICATNIDVCRHFFEYWGALCDRTTEAHWSSSVSGEFVKALFSTPMFSPFKRYNSLIGIDEEQLSRCISKSTEFEMHFSLHWFLFGKLTDTCSRHFDVIIREQMDTDEVCRKLRRYIAEVFETLQANTTVFSLMRNESLTCKIVPELFDLLGRFCLFGIGECTVDQLTLFINGYDTGYVFPLVNSALCGDVAAQMQLLKEVKRYNVSLTQSKIPSSNELFFNVYKDVFSSPFAVILEPNAKSNQFRDNEFHNGFHLVRLECGSACESFSCETILNQKGLSPDVFKLLAKQGEYIPDKKCALIPCFRENVGTGISGVEREFTASLIVGYRQDDDRKIRKIEECLLPFYSWLMRGAIEFSGIGVAIDFVRYEHKVQVANTHSAIGSIMSRNGSHNIGSHVLAALSHNVGTMPEDRKLYQYIQHRMDYIATATTDFPVWRQPTLLVSDMMRTFLSQTHLLNYISGSEGLHAYQFQNPTVDPSAQHETIKLHVRRVREWEYEPAASDCDYGEGPHDEIDSRAIVYKGKTTGISYFIVYPDQEEPLASFDQDLSVAIPGGVVGQHAFFTILENLIRNAAKHEWSKAEWSKPEDKDKPAVYKDQSDLEVYVDFRDNPQEGVVEMLVWNDRVGKASSGMGKTVKSLTDKIKSSFISPETGELVRENWGLAEMRISAGFLKHAEIDTIGGIGEKEGAAIDLVRPVVVRHGDKECLGFRFDFLKPKELLVVVSDDVEEASIQSANEVLSRFGIEMMRMEDALKSKGLAYSYVLIDGFDFKRSENEWPKLPFRVLSPTDYSTETDSVAARRVAFYDGDLYHSQNGEEFPAKIKSLIDKWKDGDKAKKFAHSLLEDIYACWVNHVRKARGVSKEAPLIVDVAGGEGGRAKSLVTDSDLIHYIFEHSFNSAVRSYLETVREKSIDPQLAGALYSLIMLDTRQIMTVKEFLNCRCPPGSKVDENEYKVIIQLVHFSETALEKLSTTIDVDKPDCVGDRWTDSLRGMATKKCLVYLYAGLKAIRAGGTGGDVGDFVRYLCKTVLGQARAFLSKYEERVVTLPPSFGATEPPPGTPKITWSRGMGNRKDDYVLTAIASSNRPEVKSILKESVLNGGDTAKGMCYLRHGDEASGPSEEKTSESTLQSFSQYLEPLSGSQSYLSSLIAFQHNIGHLSRKCSDERLFAIREMAGMVENSLMRILLIDERATKFAQEHSEVAQIFNDVGIFVCDDNNPTVVGLFNSRFDGFVDSAKRVFAKDCEIAVIHQGIIDKVLKDHSEKTVEGFLDNMTNRFRYVVVTTGRGTPANIPSTARVLPFSVVENALFKRYPEKMLLVDNIMNILPGKEVKR